MGKGLQKNIKIMKKGIVITTSQHTKEWLKQLLESISPCNYLILIVCNGGKKIIPDIKENKLKGLNYITEVNEANAFEIGGINKGKDVFDEFIYLHDTVIVKNTSLFDVLFDIKGHVFITEKAYHYMGKFVSKDLPHLPSVFNKEDAIKWELHWLQRPYTVMPNPLPVHTDIFEKGRMKLESRYIIKYKGTYHL